jgi:two-component system cell cycle sensor histidine kinase/response regulator CckA
MADSGSTEPAPGVSHTESRVTRPENGRTGNEGYYRALFEGMPVGLYRIAPSGQILEANPALAQMLGYPDSTSLMAINMNETHVTPGISARWQHLLEREGVVRNFEKHLRRCDGSILWVEENARVVRDADGRAQYYEGSLQDITDRKQSGKEMQALQEQLRQSQKLGAIGRLAGGIAHDFNNLLTVIKGYSQLSLMDSVENNALRENAAEILRAADRAEDLTRQLLAFSRRQILDMRVLDLNVVIKDLEKILRRVIGEDIELVTELAEDLGKVNCDVGHLEQIIINLLVNARDAMPSGGRLTIQTKNIEPGEAHAWSQLGIVPGRYVCLTVKDVGTGMTPEAMEHLFEPYFTTKEQGKGTGLGLSMVYGIVQQSGGTISVKSKPGSGTVMTIYFPRVEADQEECAKNESEEDLPRGNETVLVVEDEEKVRRLVLTVLRKQGYQVLEAADGKEALSLYLQLEHPPHLLVTDVVMPGMSGCDLAQQLAPLCPQMKILYISGYTENAVVQDGVLDQGIEFLQKPFSPANLIHKVRKVLDP